MNLLLAGKYLDLVEGLGLGRLTRLKRFVFKWSALTGRALVQFVVEHRKNPVGSLQKFWLYLAMCISSGLITHFSGKSTFLVGYGNSATILCWIELARLVFFTIMVARDLDTLDCVERFNSRIVSGIESIFSAESRWKLLPIEERKALTKTYLEQSTFRRWQESPDFYAMISFPDGPHVVEGSPGITAQCGYPYRGLTEEEARACAKTEAEQFVEMADAFGDSELLKVSITLMVGALKLKTN